MRTPFLNTRMYIDDSMFSVDFYEDYKNKDYVSLFLEGLASVTRALETREGLRLRPTIFYFTRCSNCGFCILTNRDHGYKIDCKNCNYESLTSAINDPELNLILDNIHRALGKSVENLKGKILLLLIQPSDPANIDSITKLCQNFGFEKLEDNHPAIAALAVEGHKRGILMPDKRLHIFKSIPDKDIFAYSNEDPPTIDKLIRGIRDIDDNVRSTSTNLDPGEKDLISLMIQGRFNEAADILEKEVQTNPSDVTNLVLLSDILMKNDRLLEAREKIMVAQAIDPTDSFVWYELGRVQFKLGNHVDAIKAFEEATKINPLDRSSMIEMAVCYRKIGRLDLAARIEAKIQSMGGIF